MTRPRRDNGEGSKPRHRSDGRWEVGLRYTHGAGSARHWVATGLEALGRRESTRIRCEDFQMYLWGEALSDSSNWELAGRDY